VKYRRAQSSGVTEIFDNKLKSEWGKMISENSVINDILADREYRRKNCVSQCLYEWVDIGDGDEYQDCVHLKYNGSTGCVSVISSLRFHGSKKIYTRRNCGKIDLDNLPLDVLARYRGYRLKHDNNRRLKRRKLL